MVLELIHLPFERHLLRGRTSEDSVRVQGNFGSGIHAKSFDLDRIPRVGNIPAASPEID
jgi:hypothetical protein